MRTTLTLDDDVSVLLQRMQAEKKATLKDVVNEALRAGLAQMSKPPEKRKPFYTKTLIHTPPIIPMPDSVSELLALAEGEDHR